MTEITTTEQEYQTELNRQRRPEKEMQAHQRKYEEKIRGAAKISAERTAGKINPIEGSFMVGFALIVDGAQLLLDFFIIGFAINWIISAVIWIVFLFWLNLKGVSMMDARGARMLFTSMGALGLEILPVTNWLPVWTAFAIGLLVMEYGKKFLPAQSGSTLSGKS